MTVLRCACMVGEPPCPAVPGTPSLPPAGPCHVPGPAKEPDCSPTSVLAMAGEASSVEEGSLLASITEGRLAAQHSHLDQD